VLDIGCNTGEALLAAYQLGYRQLLGVDINPRAAETAQQRLAHLPGSTIAHGSADSLPFADQVADAALCCDVLEHVPEGLRRSVVAEAHRVLKPEGAWVLTVPAAGAFAWLDPANVRLAFPRAFARVARWIGGAGREAGYQHQKHGIVWHKHFTLEEIRTLLAPHFRIESVRFRGMLLAPLSTWLEFPFHRWGAHDHPIVRQLVRARGWEMSIPTFEALGYDVLIVARRNPSSS
jgi:SAM-dependent methyltransferase